MGIDPGFWSAKEVFVTGHTGFKGSWLSLWLERLGAEVVGYSADVPTNPSLFELARVGERLTSIEGDVRDRDGLRGAVARHRPDIVVHMAAQPLVRRSFRSPVETYETNVMGTVHVLEAVRGVEDVRVVVVVTSDKCYESRDPDRSYREDDPKGGRDPYSSSKACAELVTSAYRDSFFDGQEGDGPALASVRAGNVIGGGDWAEDRLVADVMTAALEGRSVLIRNPDAVRPWQHVLSPLEGYLMLAERLWEDGSFADGWNFGPDERDIRPVRWILERLSVLWGEEIAWELDERSRPQETQALRLDSARARTRLGWAPRWDLDQALESVVAWYRAFQAGEDVRDVALGQIRAYESAPSVTLPA